MFPKFSRASGLLTLFILVLGLAFTPAAHAQYGVVATDAVDQSFVATLTMSATNTGYVMDVPRITVGNQQALIVDLVNTATPTLSTGNTSLGSMKVEVCGHVCSATIAATTTEFRVIDTWTSYGLKEVSTRGLGQIFFRVWYTSADTNAHKIYGRWRDD